MQIDFSQIVTAEEKVAKINEELEQKIKTECENHIVDELGRHTLSNIQGAAIAGELSDDELITFRMCRSWVADMLDASRLAIRTNNNPIWPKLPDGVTELVSRY